MNAESITKSFRFSRRWPAFWHEGQMPDWAGFLWVKFPAVGSKTPVKCPGYSRAWGVVGLEFTGTLQNKRDLKLVALHNSVFVNWQARDKLVLFKALNADNLSLLTKIFKLKIETLFLICLCLELLCLKDVSWFSCYAMGGWIPLKCGN